jgi:hypothetical protein
MEVRARMKVLIGVDPHKASVAVAAVNEAGELVERASFPHNRVGLRALEDAGPNASPNAALSSGERRRSMRKSWTIASKTPADSHLLVCWYTASHGGRSCGM